MKSKPEVTRRELIAKTRIFKVEALDLTFSNGEQRQYERLLGSDSGAVLGIGMRTENSGLVFSE